MVGESGTPVRPIRKASVSYALRNGFESRGRYPMSDGMLTHVEALKQGQVVKFRPHGNSMVPIVLSGQLVTVVPFGSHPIEVDSVVLCKVNGRQMLHKVTAIGSDGRYQISNNHGHVNGWCTPSNVFGVMIAVEP